MSLRDHAKGRWPEIIAKIVGDEYVDTSKHQACPTGIGKDCFRFSDVNGAGNFFCKCSEGDRDGFDLLQCVTGKDFAAVAKDVESIIGKAPDDEPKPAKPHWSERIAAEATVQPRSRYLESRGLRTPDTLLWHRKVPYFVDGNALWHYAAMVAPVTRGDRVVAYHLTYLDNGRKADVPSPRKLVGGKGLRGAAVQLSPAGRGRVLGVAEGIETALAAEALRGIPVWAALNTSLLSGFEWPESVERLVIFADNDANYAGHAAAYSLAHRAVGQGVEVEILFPEAVGDDWNDVLLKQREVA